MSETWSASRTSINRLKSAWHEADEETRWDIRFWAFGLALMAVALVSQFGWAGLMFCLGAVIWKAGDHALKRS